MKKTDPITACIAKPASLKTIFRGKPFMDVIAHSCLEFFHLWT